MESKERTIFVGYIVGKGFMQGKSWNKKYTDDFMNARIFSKAHHVKAAHRVKGDEVLAIPVSMSLDPEDLFTQIMGFKE